MSSPPNTTRRVAVLFSSIGSGMGDVGKFCIAQGLKDESVDVRPVALFVPAEGSPTAEIAVDVTYAAGRERIQEAFAKITDLPTIDVSDSEALKLIEKQIEGCDAVIACLGNRQPSKTHRWCGPGAELVVAAMKAQGISRLVNLSSMGIGDDYLPKSFMKGFWYVFLRVAIPAAHKDLLHMERVVEESGLDFLLARVMGISPEEPPKAAVDVVEKRDGSKLAIVLSKEDAAAYLLQEAITPQRHKASVTVGYKS